MLRPQAVEEVDDLPEALEIQQGHGAGGDLAIR